jgi:hypothetical protein
VHARSCPHPAALSMLLWALIIRACIRFLASLPADSQAAPLVNNQFELALPENKCAGARLQGASMAVFTVIHCLAQTSLQPWRSMPLSLLLQARASPYGCVAWLEFCRTARLAELSEQQPISLHVVAGQRHTGPACRKHVEFSSVMGII